MPVITNEVNLELARELLKNPKFPRTCKYDPEWMVTLDLGCPTFWLLERLCEKMDLKPGMRILDLGCGKAAGAVFLAMEFDVEVWAVDSMVSQSENWERIKDLNLNHRFFPSEQTPVSFRFQEISLMQSSVLIPSSFSQQMIFT